MFASNSLRRLRRFIATLKKQPIKDKRLVFRKEGPFFSGIPRGENCRLLRWQVWAEFDLYSRKPGQSRTGYFSTFTPPQEIVPGTLLIVSSVCAPDPFKNSPHVYLVWRAGRDYVVRELSVEDGAVFGKLCHERMMAEFSVDHKRPPRKGPKVGEMQFKPLHR